MSRTNETRHIKCHETYKCRCRLDASFSNNKQRWIKIKADVNVKNWSTKEYVIRDLFGILAIVNVNVINYVMLENKLVQESSEKIDGNETTHNDYKHACNSCTGYIILFAIAFLTIICVKIAFIYFYGYLKSDPNIPNINPSTETVIY